jgi:peptidoglycan/xylan/chitin deacetylase (PgdA/CDA1 family)
MIGEHFRDLGKRLAGRASVGLSSLLGSRAGASLGILVYHRVAAAVPGVPRPALNVTPARFRGQLAGLRARGFQFWPLLRVLEHRARGVPIPPRTVVVTFDDGFASVCTGAWPVLQELHVPATVFVNTAYLDSGEPFPFDDWGKAQRQRVPAEAYRPLSTAQAREMARSGLVELGAHTHTHADFRGRPEEFRQDLQTCVEVLRQRFGLAEVTFAFPFGRRSLGYVSDALLEAARQTGVLCALTTEAVLVEPGSDPFGWGRFNAYDWDSGATLAAKLGGWYGWAPRLQERLARLVRRGGQTNA